jgi:hypothetical protein
MRSIILCIGLVVCLSTAQSQVLSDSITVYRRKVGYELMQGPIPIGSNRIAVLMKDCPMSYKHYVQGKRTEGIGMLLTAIGVVATGAALGDYYVNRRSEFPTDYLIPSVLCLGVGVPLYFSGGRRVILGVASYNHHCVDHE